MVNNYRSSRIKNMIAAYHFKMFQRVVISRESVFGEVEIKISLASPDLHLSKKQC